MLNLEISSHKSLFNKTFLVYNQIDFDPLTMVYNAFIYSPMLQNNEFEDIPAFQHYGNCGGGITVCLRSYSYNPACISSPIHAPLRTLLRTLRTLSRTLPLPLSRTLPLPLSRTLPLGPLNIKKPIFLFSI